MSVAILYFSGESLRKNDQKSVYYNHSNLKRNVDRKWKCDSGYKGIKNVV